MSTTRDYFDTSVTGMDIGCGFRVPSPADDDGGAVTCGQPGRGGLHHSRWPS